MLIEINQAPPAQVRHLIDRAIRIALGERRVTAIILPNDLQETPYEEPPRRHTIHSGVGFSKPKTVPYEADLHRVADVLNSGRKIAILSVPVRSMPPMKSLPSPVASKQVRPRPCVARQPCRAICHG